MESFLSGYNVYTFTILCYYTEPDPNTVANVAHTWNLVYTILSHSEIHFKLPGVYYTYLG